MDRTETSIAPARGGDRTPDPSAPDSVHEVPRRDGTTVLNAMATALFVGTLLLGILPSPFSGRAWAAPAAKRPDRLALVRQSPWVGPGAPNQDLTLGLRITSGSPPSSLALSFTVFKAVTTRSGFDETLGGHGLGPALAQSPSIALSAFSTDAQGVTDVTIPVDGDTAPTGAGNWTADLGCQPGSCADVYPVRVTLTDSASTQGATGAQLVTYLVYDDPSSTSQALRLALVVPVGLVPPVAGRDGHVPAPGSRAAAEVEGLVDAVGGSPAVPLTLEPDPATLERLVATGHARTVAEVAALSASPARQTLSGSFVPVDAGALAGAGLTGELDAQLRRSDEVLGSPAVDVHNTKGTWVARAPVDQAALDELGPEAAHLVVPQAAVSGPSGPLTVTQPFTVTAADGSSTRTTAAESDAGLGLRLEGAKGGGAALDAVQMLAEASLIYYEVPNLLGPAGKPAPRGVVAVAPSAWAPNPTFVSALLSGLEANPVIQPVTLDQLFTQVPVGADDEADTRHLVASTTSGALPIRGIRGARARQAGFASAVAATAAGASAAQSTGDLLLSAESDLLSPHQQQVAVAGFTSALDARLHGLSVRSDTIRLTAGTASVPITVLRDTSYPVTVLVQLTSDKLRFPLGSTQAPSATCKAPHVQSTAGRSTFSALCTLDHATNAVYVDMSARASGDFQIDVALASPDGNLVLAGGQLTVSSLSTSAVAIALSVGAVVVLFAWWGRTLWRGRSRRGAHAISRAERPTT